MANITCEHLIISQPPRRHGLFARLTETLAEWRRRGREREDLAHFDMRALRDIGLTPAEANREINKPFWQA